MLDSRKIVAIGAVLMVLIAGALMQDSVLRVYGVAPNLVLVCLVVASFFTEQILFYAVLTLLAGWSIRTSPQFFDPLATVTTVLGLLVFWLQRRFVVKGFFGVSLLIVLTTIAYYVVINPSFLWLHFGILLGELLYNLLIGFALFELTDRFLSAGVRR